MEKIKTTSCKHPFMKDSMAFGCGQCLGCRITKRREWTNRIMLESMAHESNAFVTLTYDPEHLPTGANLRPDHLKNWQKNIRYHSNLDLRFFSVGEYGDQTQRPHYHAIIFGFPGCASRDSQCPCLPCKTLRASWKKGFIYNGTLTKDSAQYCAGYVTKKLTTSEADTEKKISKIQDKNHDGRYDKTIDKLIEYQEILNGRSPEFARMSLKPGIGTGGKTEPVIQTIQDMLETEHGCNLIQELNDVPDIIQLGKQQILLGSYLKNKLRKRMGIDEKTLEKKLLQMQEENKKAIEEKAIQEKGYKIYTAPLISKREKHRRHKEILLDENIQKIRKLEKRYKRDTKKGEL